ncbi:XAC2610-related protein [Flavobacterium sp.]|uniref:XAC2610-related protein n=1 Tax=Flavobacterium sp. TaxID=239 RepID=UPI00286B8B95|nr:hypothetical protein [Flavobacterium sp.]
MNNIEKVRFWNFSNKKNDFSKMKNEIIKIVIVVFIFFNTNAFGQAEQSFILKDNIKVSIKNINNFEKIEIKTSKNNKMQTISDIETSITEKETFLEIEDYNFDGFKDFSYSHVDDGMGVYTIYQIFIYNKKTNQFQELQIPNGFKTNCDQFCDVVINKKRKTISSSCRGGAKWHTDIWKFDKNGKMIR